MLRLPGSLRLLALLCGMIALPAIAVGNTILIVGDSLSDAYNMPREAGWAQLLDERLGDDYRVINASISGETTAGGAERVSSLLDLHRPQLLLLILGGNDGLRALSPAQIEENLERIILSGQAGGAQVALMQIRMPPNLGPAYLRRFEGLFPRLAERHGIPLLPFFLEDIFDQPGMMMADGIHPTPEAQPLMLERLWPALRPLLTLD